MPLSNERKEYLKSIVDNAFEKLNIQLPKQNNTNTTQPTQSTQSKNIEFPKSNNTIDEYEAFHNKLAGLHMDIPAFSGMLVNDEIGAAILNYKYNNNLLTDTNTVYILTNENAVMPTGDPGIKPVELLSWAKDFKASSVPYRIPGFSSPDSKQDHPSLRFKANNPINCKNITVDDVVYTVRKNLGKQEYINAIEQYADYFFDDVKKYYGENKQAFIDNIYAVIMRESSGRPHLSNTKTHDCGLGQIHVSYNNVVSIVNSLKENAPELYNLFSNDINRLIDKNTDMDTRCEILTKNVKLNIALTYAALVGKIKHAKNLERGNLNYVGNIKQFAGMAHCYFKSLQEKYPNLKIYSG